LSGKMENQENALCGAQVLGEFRTLARNPGA
jgi:hypothetical protein